MILTYFFSSVNVSDTCEIINRELKNVMQWFITTRLSVNLKKTCFMGFGAKAHSSFGSNKISLNGVDIAKVSHAKFLGVLVDDKLTWKSHITHISNKVAKNIGILNKLRHRVPLNTLHTLYNTLLMPYFGYCNIIWGSTKPTRLDHLVKLQKKHAVLTAFHQTCYVEWHHILLTRCPGCLRLPFCQTIYLRYGN